jgi:hypothetical protein
MELWKKVEINLVQAVIIHFDNLYKGEMCLVSVENDENYCQQV